METTLIGSTLVVKDNRFLLVKARIGTPKGFWNNPGGRLEGNETVEEAAVRETEEETGYRVSLKRLVAVFDWARLEEGKRTIKFVFEAGIVSGKLKIPVEEIDEADWFSLSDTLNESFFTFGAVQSMRDFAAKKFGQLYACNRVP
jgi:ADP-ribose pyrophosphatase YjhB (NUDIX family)